jgi:hypothetical protein
MFVAVVFFFCGFWGGEGPHREESLCHNGELTAD